MIKLSEHFKIQQDKLSTHKHKINPLLYVLAVIFCYFIGMSILKNQSQDVLPWQNVLTRAVLAVAVLGSVLISRGVDFKLKKISMHAPRAFFHLLGQLCWMYGISHVTLATVIAVEFSGPIWVALLAKFMLSEAITRQKIFAIVIGMIGVLLVVGPDQLKLEETVLILICGAISYSVANVLFKMISNKCSAVEAAWSMAALHLPILGVYAALNWVPFSTQNLLLSLAASLFFIFGQLSLFKALSFLEATKVATLDLLRLPIVVLAGSVFFDEKITAIIVIGIVLIGASGITMSRAKT